MIRSEGEILGTPDENSQASGSLEHTRLLPLKLWRKERLAASHLFFQLFGIWCFWRGGSGDRIRERGSRFGQGLRIPTPHRTSW